MLSLTTRWHGNTSAVVQRSYSRFDTEFERVKQCLDRLHSSLVDTSRQHLLRDDAPGTQATRLPLANG